MKSKEVIHKEILALVPKVNIMTKGKYQYMAYLLDNVIDDDEELKMVVSGLYEKKIVDVICTNRRIIISGSGIAVRRVDIQISEITNMKMEMTLKDSYIKIFSKGGDFILGIGDKQKFMNVVNEQIKKNNENQNKSNVTINNITTSSGADEILKYKSLLDQGIITQEEFDKKKKELLGL